MYYQECINPHVGRGHATSYLAKCKPIRKTVTLTTNGKMHCQVKCTVYTSVWVKDVEGNLCRNRSTNRGENTRKKKRIYIIATSKTSKTKKSKPTKAEAACKQCSAGTKSRSQASPTWKSLRQGRPIMNTFIFSANGCANVCRCPGFESWEGGVIMFIHSGQKVHIPFNHDTWKAVFGISC